MGAKNRIVILDSTVDRPDEVFAVENGKARQLTHHNDAWLAGVKLGQVEEISATSKDGTRINGFVVTPPDYRRRPQVSDGAADPRRPGIAVCQFIHR